MSFVSNNISRKTKIVVSLITALIVVIIGLLLVEYTNFVQKNLTKSTWVKLEEIAKQQKYNVSIFIEDKIDYIQNAALRFEKYDENIEDNKTDIVNELNICSQYSGFESLFFSDLTGRGYYNSGLESNISKRNYFLPTIQGNSFVSEPVKSYADDNNVMVFSTPVRDREKNIIGAFVGGYPVDELSKFLLSSFDGAGYGYIVNSKGEIIAQSGYTDTISDANYVLKTLKEFNFHQFDHWQVLTGNISDKLSGDCRYIDENGDAKLMRYTPLGYNDWTLLSIVPESVVFSLSNQIIKLSVFMTVCIFILFIIIFISISVVHSKNAEKLYELAYYDRLTNLPNMVKFKLEVEALLNKYPQKRFSCIKLDIQNFRVINQLYGNKTGDICLKKIAELCEEFSKIIDVSSHIVTRCANDEFMIFYAFDDKAPMTLEEKRSLLVDEARKKLDFLGEFRVDMCFGRYTTEEDDTADNIVECVSLAHKAAKEDLKSLYIDYYGDYKQILLQNNHIKNNMEYAIEHNEIQVFLQGKYRLSDEKLCGAEALSRWKDSSGKFIPPNNYIGVFEKNGFIVKHDMYIFEQVCKIIKEWKEKGYKLYPVSINFSKQHINKTDFIEGLCEVADRYGVERELLEIEITETTAIDNVEALKQIIDNLHEVGFKLSMDDFGSGYSSLGLLKNLDVDTLKLDRGFFSTVIEEKRAKIVVSSVITMAKKLKIKTVAEGIEDKVQIDMLKSFDCDVVQGYYYCKPMHSDEYTQKLALID